MSILQELLDLLSPDEILEEDLGNLNFLDKKFKPILKQIGTTEWRRGSGSEFVKKSGFSQNLGRDVIVEESKVKSAADIHKLITNPDREKDYLQLVVLDVAGEQFAVIKKYMTKSLDRAKDENGKYTDDVVPGTGEYKYELFIDKAFLDSHVPEEKKEGFNAALAKAKFVDSNNTTTQRSTSFSGTVTDITMAILSESNLYGQLTTLMKLLKETDLPKDLNAHAVYKDVRRLVTHRERHQSRMLNKSGDDMMRSTFSKVTRQPGETAKLDKDLYAKDAKGNYIVKDNKYLSYAKSELATRLAKFKTENATNIKELKELIEVVKKKGFPEVFRVNGMPYKLNNMNYIGFDNLKASNQKGSFTPNVEYRVDDDSPEYEAMRKKAQTLKQVFDDWENDPDYKRAVMRFWAPRYIKIRLGLGPGGIVPVEVMDPSEYN